MKLISIFVLIISFITLDGLDYELGSPKKKSRKLDIYVIVFLDVFFFNL